MIRDTCPCGAEFEVNHNTAAIPPASEKLSHKQWLDAHHYCRAVLEISGEPIDIFEISDRGAKPEGER